MGLSAQEVGRATELACILEASAAKPGNVSPGKPSPDASFEDYALSARVLAQSLRRARGVPLGGTILRAVRARRRRIRANTNLGIILLFAPLAKAALEPGPSSLSRKAQRVLEGASVADTRLVYEAIRLANPGGLGRVGRYDVLGKPPRSRLVTVMRSAAARDTIACEYATGFRLTFTMGVPVFRRCLATGPGVQAAVVQTFLTLLAKIPDSLIRRKHGSTVARSVSAEARKILDIGGVFSARGRRAIRSLDSRLRRVVPPINPGTTADLTAAAIFATLLLDAWDRLHPVGLDEEGKVDV